MYGRRTACSQRRVKRTKRRVERVATSALHGKCSTASIIATAHAAAKKAANDGLLCNNARPQPRAASTASAASSRSRGFVHSRFMSLIYTALPPPLRSGDARGSDGSVRGRPRQARLDSYYGDQNDPYRKREHDNAGPVPTTKRTLSHCTLPPKDDEK
jgi:hypothetical protein